jgi:cobalt-zinc-cadmium resistance protein CzcA
VPSASIDQSTQMQLQIENALKSLPEVALVFSKNGNADLGTDPMPPNASDTYVIPKPEKEWPAEVKSKEDILRRIEEKMKPLIGNRTEIQQPIQMRFNELIAGVRADVAVKLYGDDLDQMSQQASASPASCARSRRRRCQRRADGRRPDLRRKDRSPGGGTLRPVGRGGGEHRRRRARRTRGRALFEGDRRFAVVVGCPTRSATIWKRWRYPGHAAGGRRPGRALDPAPGGGPVQLHAGLNQISRENGKRMVVVQVNVRGRDLGGFVEEAQAKIGQCNSRRHVHGVGRHLREPAIGTAAPADRGADLLRRDLRAALHGARGLVPAAIVFSAVPMALAGGVFALLLRGIPSRSRPRSGSSPCRAWRCSTAS